MHFVILAIAVAALLFGPQLWAQYTFRRYATNRPDYPGTGGELARHLLDLFELGDVAVEITDKGDHYDPTARCVRLTEGNYAGRSLTAVAVAAHEVGHALQHAGGERMLALRTRLVGVAIWLQRSGAAMMMAIPVVTALTRAPSSGLLMGGLGLLTMGGAALAHLVTLPVEWDASFGKALPLLRRYLPEEDLPAVRRILRAAALTYLAASLASLLNVWRWLRLLRGR